MKNLDRSLPDARLRLLSYLVIAYMVLAFAWWSVLLFIKNRDAFQAKAELMKIGMVAEGRVRTPQEFEATDAYQTLLRQYRRQEWMIMGEATVFVLTLMVGIYLINRGYNREMQAAHQRRNFLLSITHELKSPLASIRLVLETLAERPLRREQSQSLLTNALQETERLDTLINNLLLSAKLDSSYQPTFEPLNARELVQELVEKIRTRHPEAALKVTFPNEKLPPLHADRLGFTSVLLNLLENAVKYSQQAPEIELRLWTSNGTLHLVVADQGIGIPKEERERIFEKFYRIGNEDTRRAPGTGLGLFIVHQIVRAHGGRIRVLENRPKGTTFHIELPLHPPQAQEN
ncbi:MAG: sensor histidine kinase [Bacteroidetes bacterium]|nr:MAG: sensor histidine kinase [Bacteroidota bacterium]